MTTQIARSKPLACDEESSIARGHRGQLDGGQQSPRPQGRAIFSDTEECSLSPDMNSSRRRSMRSSAQQQAKRDFHNTRHDNRRLPYMSVIRARPYSAETLDNCR